MFNVITRKGKERKGKVVANRSAEMLTHVSKQRLVARAQFVFLAESASELFVKTEATTPILFTFFIHYFIFLWLMLGVV